MRKLILLMSVLFLSSCANTMTDMALGALTPSKGVEATAQVGKENTKNGVGLTYDDRKDVHTEDVAGDVNVTNNTTVMIPWWYAIITAICGILVNPFTVKRLLFTKELQ